MPTIKVERKHTLGEEEALKRAQDLVRGLADRLKAEVEWDGTDARFKGTGFSGKAAVRGDTVAVNVDLGLLLSPMKGKIESRLERELQEKFS